MAGVSRDVQAENQRALEKWQAEFEYFVAGTVAATSLAAEQVALELLAEIDDVLSQSGNGRLYPSRTGSGLHRASAPGEPPAPDTTSYRQSWDMEIGESDQGGYADVFTADERGPWLEFGTRNMMPRPHLRLATERLAGKISTTTAEAIARRQEELVHRASAEAGSSIRAVRGGLARTLQTVGGGGSGLSNVTSQIGGLLGGAAQWLQ